MNSYLWMFLSLVMITSCGKEDGGKEMEQEHLQYFGFTLIDTFWDDPTDAEEKINYIDEVHSFSNLADILTVGSEDNIVDRVNRFYDVQVRAVIHMNELFFEYVDDNSLSGANYDLRSDFKERWDQWRDINREVLNADRIGAFYIGEEPTWNGIAAEELEAVSDLLETDFPNIPKMIVEAYPAIELLKIPSSVDWVGFDRYFIKDPHGDKDFIENWEALKSKITRDGQRIIMIMDSHYLATIHGEHAGIALDDMDEVAYSYYKPAREEPLVIGVLGYFWPNGFDLEGAIGARGMPATVKDAYIEIGKEITGKK